MLVRVIARRAHAAACARREAAGARAHALGAAAARAAAAAATPAAPLRRRGAAAGHSPAATAAATAGGPLARRALLRGILLAAAPPAGAGLFPSLSAAAAAAGGGGSGMATAAGGGGAGDAVVVYVTVPSQAVADGLSEALVGARLAACVNIVPGVTSVYWWDGKVNRDSELLLVMKTRGELVPDLTAAVKRLHPYDEPEVVALPITAGSASYLEWVRASTEGADASKLPPGKLPAS